MPRCQRTFYRLAEGRLVAGTGIRQWTCRHCADAEVYETIRDPDLIQYRDLAYAYCAEQFGPPADRDRPTILLLGLRPECVHEAQERHYDLYLQRGSDPLQIRLQIGHEMFHRACSQGRIFHWTHEMLACMTSVRLLRRCGSGEYAQKREREWLAEACLLPLSDMLSTDLWTANPYPAGFYGRAYATGVMLAQAIGWSHLRRLARSLSPGGLPDVAGWLERLPPDLRAKAAAIMKGNDAAGVE